MEGFVMVGFGGVDEVKADFLVSGLHGWPNGSTTS